MFSDVLLKYAAHGASDGAGSNAARTTANELVVPSGLTSHLGVYVPKYVSVTNVLVLMCVK